MGGADELPDARVQGLLACMRQADHPVVQIAGKHAHPLQQAHLQAAVVCVRVNSAGGRSGAGVLQVEAMGNLVGQRLQTRAGRAGNKRGM